MNKLSIGEKIKTARKKAGLTQKELGEKLGVSAAMIAQYETGKRTPKIETIQKIAGAVGVSADEIGFGLPSIEEDYEKLVQISLQLHGLPQKSLSGKDEQELRKMWAQGEDELFRKIKAYTQEQDIQKKASLKKNLLSNYDLLNVNGQQKAVEHVEMLTKIPEYRADTQPPAAKTPAPSDQEE